MGDAARRALKSSVASLLSRMCKLAVRGQNSIQTSLSPAPVSKGTGSLRLQLAWTQVGTKRRVGRRMSGERSSVTC